MTYPDYRQAGSSQTTLAGSTAEDTASITVPSATPRYDDTTNFVDSDGDNGLPDGPAIYEGPAVADQAPLVNPSAGTTGPTEAGANDVNPQGPAPTPGRGPVSDVQAPPNPQQAGTGYGRVT